MSLVSWEHDSSWPKWCSNEPWLFSKNNPQVLGLPMEGRVPCVMMSRTGFGRSGDGNQVLAESGKAGEFCRTRDVIHRQAVGWLWQHSNGGVWCCSHEGGNQCAKTSYGPRRVQTASGDTCNDVLSEGYSKKDHVPEVEWNQHHSSDIMWTG